MFVFQVRAPWVKMFFYGDYDTYVIPGRRAVTVGGTRQLESYNETVDRHDSAAIWERATALVPSLGGGEVLRKWVGLRPHRDPVRCELQHIPAGPNPRSLKVSPGSGRFRSPSLFVAHIPIRPHVISIWESKIFTAACCF